MVCSAAPVLLLAMTLPLVGPPVARASQPVSKTGVRALGKSAEATVGTPGVRGSEAGAEMIGGGERAGGLAGYQVSGTSVLHSGVWG